MDILIIGCSLAGLGYYLNKNEKQNRYSEKDLYKHLTPNTDNRFNEVRNDIKNELDDEVNFVNNNANKENVFISDITGLPIGVNNWSKNKQPYIKSKDVLNPLKYNTDSYNINRLENFTGSSFIGDNMNLNVQRNKAEVDNILNPAEDIYQLTPNLDQNRFNQGTSQYKRSELPIEQTRVAPGLNVGYNSSGSGGFHQYNIQDIMRPKTIDELRTQSNQQETYKGRVISGQQEITRGNFTDFDKNKPSRVYSVTPDMYFTTLGDVTKERVRSQILMPCAKKPTEEYFGDSTSHIKKPKKETTMMVKDTIRQETGKYTQLGIGESLIKSRKLDTADALRRTRKENFIGNNNQAGYLSMPEPNKMTVYDPNDTLRTTLKETNIHSAILNNMNSNVQKPTVYNPDEVLRTTIKETNIHNSVKSNLVANGPKKITTYDPNDILRTTIKETNIHNDRLGNIDSRNKEITRRYEDGVKTTIRETLDPEDTVLNMEGIKKMTVYDPNDSLKTTIKETNIHNDRSGNVELAYGTTGQGYLTNEKQAPITNKQTIAVVPHTNNAKYSVDNPPTYQDLYNATVNTVKEQISRGRSPTQNNVKLASGVNDINIQQNKIQSDAFNKREMAMSKTYQCTPKMNDCSITSLKNQYSNRHLADRLADYNVDQIKNRNEYSNYIN